MSKQSEQAISKLYDQITPEEWNDLIRIIENEQRIQEEDLHFEEDGPSPFLKAFFYEAYKTHKEQQ